MPSYTEDNWYGFNPYKYADQFDMSGWRQASDDLKRQSDMYQAIIDREKAKEAAGERHPATYTWEEGARQKGVPIGQVKPEIPVYRGPNPMGQWVSDEGKASNDRVARDMYREQGRDLFETGLERFAPSVGYEWQQEPNKTAPVIDTPTVDPVNAMEAGPGITAMIPLLRWLQQTYRKNRAAPSMGQQIYPQFWKEMYGNAR